MYVQFFIIIYHVVRGTLTRVHTVRIVHTVHAVVSLEAVLWKLTMAAEFGIILANVFGHAL